MWNQNLILDASNAALLVTNYTGNQPGYGNSPQANPGVQTFPGVPLTTSTGTGTGQICLPVSIVGGGGSSSGGSIITDMSAGEYKAIAASQSNILLGASGAVGDYLMSLVIVPATVDAGQVSIKDGNGGSIIVFTGGTGSVTNLATITVPLSIKAAAATTPGWRVTTGANVSVIATGNFT